MITEDENNKNETLDIMSYILDNLELNKETLLWSEEQDFIEFEIKINGCFVGIADYKDSYQTIVLSDEHFYCYWRNVYRLYDSKKNENNDEGKKLYLQMLTKLQDLKNTDDGKNIAYREKHMVAITIIKNDIKKQLCYQLDRGLHLIITNNRDNFTELKKLLMETSQ